MLTPKMELLIKKTCNSIPNISSLFKYYLKQYSTPKKLENKQITL